MNRNRIRIERIVRASASIYSEADRAPKDDISCHRRATGSAELAFDLDGLRGISRFGHRDGEGFSSPQLDEFRRRHTVFAG